MSWSLHSNVFLCQQDIIREREDRKSGDWVVCMSEPLGYRHVLMLDTAFSADFLFFMALTV